MNGADIKKAVISKAKQAVAEVQATASNGSSGNGSKKRRKQELKPIITTESNKGSAS